MHNISDVQRDMEEYKNDYDQFLDWKDRHKRPGSQGFWDLPHETFTSEFEYAYVQFLSRNFNHVVYSSKFTKYRECALWTVFGVSLNRIISHF